MGDKIKCMDNKDFEKYLNKVRNNISNIHNQFYVLRALRNNDYKNIYDRNNYFWGVMLYSLENCFFLELPRLFERNEKQRVISIYSLLEFLPENKEKDGILEKIDSYGNTIYNLKKRRDKIYAHEDEEVFLNRDDFLKKHLIKWEEVENIIKLTETLLGDIETEFTNTGSSCSYTYKGFENESESDVKDIMGRLGRH